MTSLGERLERLDPERRTYTLNTLAEHLGEAGQSQRLRDLFADDQWMRARFEDSGNVYDGFLSDAAISLSLEQRRGKQQIDNGCEPTAIADAFRLALIRTRVTAVVSQARPAIVVRALDLHLWTAERAMNVAAKRNQLELYTALLASDHLTAAQRERVLNAALSIVLGWREDTLANGLEKLGPHLAHEHAVRALAALQDITYGGHRVRALAGIAGSLDSRRRTEALTRELERVRTQPGWKHLDATTVLQGLAAHLDGSLFESAMAIADGIEADDQRAETFAALARRKGEPLQNQCLERVLSTPEEAGHKALATMIPGLIGAAFDKAIAATLQMKDGYYRGKVLAETAPHFPQGLLPAAVDAALSIGFDLSRRDVVVALSGRLDAQLLQRVFDYALEEPRDDYRAGMLLALLPRLVGNAKARAIAELTVIARPLDLAKLAAHVEGAEKNALLARALGAVPAPDSGQVSTRAILLRAVITDLPGSHLAQALSLATTLGDEKQFAETLHTLAPLADPDLLSAIVDAALALDQERDRTLEKLAAHLSAELLNKILDHVHQVDDLQERATALLDLASALSADQRAAIVPWTERAIEKSRYTIPELLGRLSIYAEGVDKERLLDAMVKNVAAIENEWQQSSTLAGISGYLRPRQVEATLELARKLPHEHNRAKALTAMVPLLCEEQREQAVAEALRSAWTSSHGLYTLSGLVSPEQRTKVLRSGARAGGADSPYTPRAPGE